jgi:hypothetical protein
MDELIAQAQLIYPWMPRALARVFANNWIDFGTPELALAATRESDLYDNLFPGIRRDDGSLRMNEAEYFATRDAYSQVLLNWNINPAVVEHRFASLIAGDVNPSEFAERVNAVASRLEGGIETNREFFAAQFGVEPTNEAILLAALDPEIGQAVLDKTISMVDISAEASIRGFTPSVETVDRLYRFGVNATAARDIFEGAEENLPFLRNLARRHYDPNDDFTLSEFLEANVFGDPEARQRIRLLASQEQALFSEASVVASSGTGLSGLALQPQS